MLNGFDQNNRPDRAVMVAVRLPGDGESLIKEHLEELAFLALTLGTSISKSFIQSLDKYDPRTFIGKGKLQEVKQFIKQEKIELVIFDHDLSPSQLRNLEKELNCQIYDRSLLILDIFLKRAQTSQARTQVELARYQYLMPRLTRMWTHLERQRGGTSTRGGAGEKEIETDRRIIRDRISLLRKKLEKIDKQSTTRRKSRSNIVRVSLVGYTNVGKSTLMRKITKADVKAENKLFATVDSTVRKVAFDSIPFLLSDTVGFIRKLPHHLIESFKSTLDEIREADILVHVVDISHPAYEEHISVVNNTLADIGAGDKTVITVFNKIDNLPSATPGDNGSENGSGSLQDLKNSYLSGDYPNPVFVSAETGENLEEFREILQKRVAKKHYRIYPNWLLQS